LGQHFAVRAGLLAETGVRCRSWYLGVVSGPGHAAVHTYRESVWVGVRYVVPRARMAHVCARSMPPPLWRAVLSFTGPACNGGGGGTQDRGLRGGRRGSQTNDREHRGGCVPSKDVSHRTAIAHKACVPRSPSLLAGLFDQTSVVPLTDHPPHQVAHIGGRIPILASSWSHLAHRLRRESSHRNARTRAATPCPRPR